MQGKRMYAHDYNRPGFYMITMVTAGHRPLFGVCRDDQVSLSPAGEIVRRRWHEIPSFRPSIESSTLVVMPNHLHGILYVKEVLDKPLGATIRGFASGVTSELRRDAGNSSLNVWEKGFYDRVIMNSDTLRAERNYIRDNPRRYCVLKANPDIFIRVNHLKDNRLPKGERWAGFGNLFLLDKPDLMAVQISRRAPEGEIAALKARVLERIAGGAVMVSPFISQGEKEIARLIMEQDYGGLILIKPEGFPPLYKPSGKYFDLCAQGRLLVLSAFPYTGRKQALTRECCLQMNAWVGYMCANNGAPQ